MWSGVSMKEAVSSSAGGEAGAADREGMESTERPNGESRREGADVRMQHLVEADDVGLHLAEQGREPIQAVSVIFVSKSMNVEGDDPQPVWRLDAERVHSGEQHEQYVATHRSTMLCNSPRGRACESSRRPRH